jgi:hypothetical protein
VDFFSILWFQNFGDFFIFLKKCTLKIFVATMHKFALKKNKSMHVPHKIEKQIVIPM